MISAVGSGAPGGQSEREEIAGRSSPAGERFSTALTVPRSECPLNCEDGGSDATQRSSRRLGGVQSDILAGSRAVAKADSRLAQSHVRSLACPPNAKPVPGGCIPRGSVHVVYGERCKSSRRAVTHYRELTWKRQAARGGELADRTPIVRGKTCRWARYAADVWVARAKAALNAYERWSYDWEWRRWLPAKWVRVFHCETPTNGEYINWQHNSGTYEGGPGFYFGTWDQYKPNGAPERADLATPRQQYQAAENVRAVHGYGAWGCGGA